MADFGVGMASGITMEIVKSIITLAKEVQINKAQARQLSENCEIMVKKYSSNFQMVETTGRIHGESYFALKRSYDDFTGVLQTVQTLMEQWAKLGFWQRLVKKKEMESSIQARSRELDGAWQLYQNSLSLEVLAVVSNTEAIVRARPEDTQRDAELMSNTARTLRNFPCCSSIPIRREHDEISRKEVAEQFQHTDLDEDPTLGQAREELWEALHSYEGSYLPHGIDSSELTLSYGQPVRTSENSLLFRGFRKGDEVALKQLSFERNTNDRSMQQIERVFRRITHEAKLWRHLNHPNIVKFLGCCRFQADLPYLVSPWMEHGDARAYLSSHPDANSLKWVSGFLKPFLCRVDVAEGLKYLHTFRRPDSSTLHPIIHGNIRGSHVLLDGNLNALLSDFGISHLLNQTYPNSRPPKEAWSAPEVLSGETPSVESDIFSFASLTMELITNNDPFKGTITGSRYKLAARIRGGAIPSFPTQHHRVLRNEACALWKLMLRCWQFDPNARPTIEVVVVKMREIYRQDVTFNGR